MSDAEARRDATLPARLGVAGAALAVVAALGLWWRFGEGVYGQALVNAVIACF